MAKSSKPKQIKFGKNVRNVNKPGFKKVKVKESANSYVSRRRDLLTRMLESMIDGNDSAASAVLSQYMSLRSRQIIKEADDHDDADETDLDDAEDKLDDSDEDDSDFDSEDDDSDEDDSDEDDSDEDDDEDHEEPDADDEGGESDDDEDDEDEGDFSMPKSRDVTEAAKCKVKGKMLTAAEKKKAEAVLKAKTKKK